MAGRQANPVWVCMSIQLLRFSAYYQYWTVIQNDSSSMLLFCKVKNYEDVWSELKVWCLWCSYLHTMSAGVCMLCSSSAIHEYVAPVAPAAVRRRRQSSQRHSSDQVHILALWPQFLQFQWHWHCVAGTTWVSRYQKSKTSKGKTNLDLLEQEIVSGSGICWAMCKSAPHPRQPCQHPTTQFFTGRMPFLPPNQQRQSTISYKIKWQSTCVICKWLSKYLMQQVRAI